MYTFRRKKTRFLGNKTSSCGKNLQVYIALLAKLYLHILLSKAAVPNKGGITAWSLQQVEQISHFWH